jgi:hypothetical protein
MAKKKKKKKKESEAPLSFIVVSSCDYFWRMFRKKKTKIFFLKKESL